MLCVENVECSKECVWSNAGPHLLALNISALVKQNMYFILFYFILLYFIIILLYILFKCENYVLSWLCIFFTNVSVALEERGASKSQQRSMSW